MTMRPQSLLGRVLPVLALCAAVGCDAASEEQLGSPAFTGTAPPAGKADSASNTDVQVISASASRNVTDEMDLLGCEFSNTRDASGGGFNAVAQADCTMAAIDALGLPVINGYYEPQMALLQDPDVSRVSPRHWCGELDIVVAVKAAAWDSPAFEGIGFYASQPTLNENIEQQFVFYTPDDPRLVRIGEARLANEDEHVYLYAFGGAGPCETNGSGDNPRHEVQFKPFMRYSGGNDRWEAVDGNHGIGYGRAWDRSADLLRE